MQDKRKKPVESDGGFNPTRPQPPSTQTVGPLPTGNPNGEASSSLKEELIREADPKQKDS
jgi:hypothetical protein